MKRNLLQQNRIGQIGGAGPRIQIPLCCNSRFRYWPRQNRKPVK